MSVNEQTILIEQKLRTWCMNENVTLGEFFKKNKINVKSWYNFRKGKIPMILFVRKIIEGTENFITYKDFEDSLPDESD